MNTPGNEQFGESDFEKRTIEDRRRFLANLSDAIDSSNDPDHVEYIQDPAASPTAETETRATILPWTELQMPEAVDYSDPYETLSPEFVELQERLTGIFESPVWLHETADILNTFSPGYQWGPDKLEVMANMKRLRLHFVADGFLDQPSGIPSDDSIAGKCGFLDPLLGEVTVKIDPKKHQQSLFNLAYMTLAALRSVDYQVQGRKSPELVRDGMWHKYDDPQDEPRSVMLPEVWTNGLTFLDAYAICKGIAGRFGRDFPAIKDLDNNQSALVVQALIQSTERFTSNEINPEPGTYKGVPVAAIRRMIYDRDPIGQADAAEIAQLQIHHSGLEQYLTDFDAALSEPGSYDPVLREHAERLSAPDPFEWRHDIASSHIGNKSLFGDPSVSFASDSQAPRFIDFTEQE